MVKADLITGFLGSGKTTFIRNYVQALLETGERICILENDYGAVNVDMMLLGDLKSERLGLEMVAGGCDYDCHKRRFKTKLITIAMLGYDRVIIEPSGIFDVDELFDTLNEDELYGRYEIANILTIVDAALDPQMSAEADALLASQIACAGRVILSKVQESTPEQIADTVRHINAALQKISCKRTFSPEENITAADWNTLTSEDYRKLSTSGYRETGYVKHFSMDENGFTSLFFMNVQLTRGQLEETIGRMWKDDSLGKLLRIKGFIPEEEGWLELNATAEKTEIRPIHAGQKILIVIGEHLKEEKIAAYFPSEFSTLHTH